MSAPITIPGIRQLHGDGVAGPGSGDQALTLATVNGNVGAFTNANIVVDAKGRITAAANGSSNPGTVTSVALALPAIFTVSGSPVTTSGTLTGTLATQAANLMFAGPASGADAAPTFRAIASLDIATALLTPGPIGSTTANTISALGLTDSQYSTDTVGAPLTFKKARGTAGSPTVVVTGDVLSRTRSAGYDGSSYLQMASIDVVATGTIASTRVPTYMTFSVATDAAPSVLTEIVRITPTQVTMNANGIRAILGTYGLSVMKTTIAGAPLEVNGQGWFAGGNGSGSVIMMQPGAAGALSTITASTYSTYGDLAITTNGSTGVGASQIYLKSSDGAVGIGTSSPGAKQHILATDAVTNSITTVLITDHTGGTTAAGFGTRIELRGKSSTTAGRTLVDIAGLFKVETDASYEGYGLIRATYMNSGTPTARNAIGWGADGTGSRVGFHSVASAPILRPANANQAAVVTTAATNVAPYGFATAAQADAIVTLVNALRQCLVDYDLWKGAA